MHYLYLSNFKDKASTLHNSKELISKLLIGNQFQVKLRSSIPIQIEMNDKVFLPLLCSKAKFFVFAAANLSIISSKKHIISLCHIY